MASRTVHLDKSVFGPLPPKPQTARPKQPSDFPGVSRAHIDVARALSSPILLGPPLCDELVALVEHVFTEEEASVVRHLRGSGRSVREVARAEGRGREEVRALLDEVATGKGAIWNAGAGRKARYGLLPIVPGMFELIMVRQRIGTLSDWHRRYIELFEALFETGYSRSVTRQPVPVFRFLPLHNAIEGNAAALPSDKLEVVFDRFESFSLTECQCRTAMKITGEGCDRPLHACMAMGDWADAAISMGLMQRITKAEAIRLKKEAEQAGCVTWILNNESAKGQASCSCCGCCCHAMRWVSDFDAPAIYAPPHFLPQVDEDRCRYCGRCAKQCPMGAMVVDPKAKRRWMLAQRCIGCGLCSLACHKRRAITMEPVPDYKLPPRSWLAFGLRAAPGAARTAVETFLERRFDSTWWPF